MDDTAIAWGDFATAAVAVLLLVAAVSIRAISKSRIEIKLNDVLIALAAAFLVLFMLGRIDKFIVSKEGITVETAKRAILTASARPIQPQISQLPVAHIDEALKGGVEMIPSLVARGIGSLDFQLGAGVYSPQAIEAYLEKLTNYPFFRFVTLLQPNGRVFGFVDGRKLLSALQTIVIPKAVPLLRSRQH
jgi:hypothetical protein